MVTLPLLPITVEPDTQTIRDADNGPCLFEKPCKCFYETRIAECINTGLKQIPNVINHIAGPWDMDLSFNNISSLPIHAFHNISLSSLQLSNNNLTYIADGAFSGSEFTMRSLYLDSNFLTQIPNEIGRLRKLRDISLDDNPIAKFSDDVLNNISLGIDKITFGSEELATWPEAIGSFRNLKYLTVTAANLETIPDDAFENLTSLFKLTIKSTNLKSLPVSLQKSTKLFILELDDNRYLQADGLKPDAFKNLGELRQFFINKSNMTTLPHIFRDLSVLVALEISDTPLKYIDDDVFPKRFSSIFEDFSCDKTLLDRIPLAVSKIETLSSISITNSDISYISDTDFIESKELFWLHLSDNPLQTVSDNAFQHTPKLWGVNFNNTELTTIPKALGNLPSVSSIDLMDAKVVCSCNNLGWMKNWKRVEKISFTGLCKNIKMTIADFVKKEVPVCSY